MTTPTVTLTSYNMGDVEAKDFDMWAGYVNEHIDARCGFTVNVDSFRFGESVDRDRVSGATDEQEETIRESLRGLWDQSCATGWDEAYRAAGIAG